MMLFANAILSWPLAMMLPVPFATYPAALAWFVALLTLAAATIGFEIMNGKFLAPIHGAEDDDEDDESLVLPAIFQTIINTAYDRVVGWFAAVFQQVISIVENLAAQVERHDGNNILRVFALPMSETYLQLVPRVPRVLTLYGCREMVPAFVTALIPRVPRILAIYGCREMILMAPRSLTVYVGRAIVLANNTAIVVRAARTLTTYATRDIAVLPVAAAEDNFVLFFLLMLIGVLYTAFQELMNFIVGKSKMLVDYLFPIVEQEEEEEAEPEERDEGSVDEPKAGSFPPLNPNYKAGALSAYKRKIAKKRYLQKIREMRAQDDVGELVELFGGLSLGD